MKVGIMQPYFYPYAGHFALIANVDRWIVFDTAQYTPKSWMNRNRILHPSDGWMYVTIPLSHSSQALRIDEARVLDMASAHRSLLGKLSHYRRKAPHYEAVIELVQNSFSMAADASLAKLDISCLAATCHMLGIDFEYQVCSELDLDLPMVDHPGGWALAIAEALGASEYVNPIGGRALFDPEEFRRHRIQLTFLELPTFRYGTPGYEFQPSLSILDALMWNDPVDVRRWVRTMPTFVSP